MAWSKVKNIILLMLVLTNLFLLFFVVLPQAQKELNVDEERLSALSIFEKHGISINASIVPQTISHSTQLIIPDRSLESTLAQNLFGQVTMLDLGGEVYRYVGDTGSIRFHSGGEFSAQLSGSTFVLSAQNALSSGDAVLSALMLDGQLTSADYPKDNTIALTYCQLWDGVPLLQYGMTLCYQEGDLTEISDAKRLYGTVAQVDDSSISVATALMQFIIALQELGDICRSVTSITAAYSASTDLSGVVQLTPVWCVETDTGSYQLSLVNGTLSRV